jgi:hypothetical protein
MRVAVRRQDPYYHASLRPIESDVMEPRGIFEAVESGCPEAVYAGGHFIGFKFSETPETAFSKSPEAAVLAELRDCPKVEVYDPRTRRRRFASAQYECPIWVYSTDQKPDIDISDCGFDFRAHQEVRYRTPVRIRPYAQVEVPAEVVERAAEILDEPEINEKGVPVGPGCSDPESGVLVDACYEKRSRPIKAFLRRLLREARR